MYRQLQRRFRERSLTPSSTMDTLPHIGPYLYERLVRAYRPRGGRGITVRQFAKAVWGMTTAQVKASLQGALKNERANLCVGTRGEKHHVRDVNEPGFRTMVALLRVLKDGRDGHDMGRGMASTPRYVAYPAKRSEAAKFGPCKSRASCRATPGLRWRADARRCLYEGPSGFEGISPLPGQQIKGRSVRVMDKKEALAGRVAGVAYVARDARSRQRVPGVRVDVDGSRFVRR